MSGFLAAGQGDMVGGESGAHQVIAVWMNNPRSYRFPKVYGRPILYCDIQLSHSFNRRIYSVNYYHLSPLIGVVRVCRGAGLCCDSVSAAS